ncbi:hypothetical protein BpHYR1_037476 [Brachionus plicatilis]|uniref:Uncharacterized protein n=1 Tax=Brachionus plicatilis TaxID=10195 RepID=A0A3M7Q6I8_BRAPC|nr:hypothetical protein BpHYR1_037476 [Brachionus plicatilis]
MATEENLKNQGIIGANEQCETLYLAEDEIEKFMEKYLKENPGAEIETRYISQPPVEMTQNIQVRWLRPETPEIPPIIIKEVDTSAPELPPLRIVEKPRQKEESSEPLIIREKPPFIIIPEPKIAYVQNVTKKEAKKEFSSDGKQIKIEHVRSESQNSFNNHSAQAKTRHDMDEQFKRDRLYSFEEHASYVDYEEYDQQPSQSYRSKIREEDEQELKLYEEKLKQTLYEEYLLRLERERLERKLSRSGLLEERIRERSMSQERISLLSNKFSNARYHDDEQRVRKVREQGMNHYFIKGHQTKSLNSQITENSSFENIKFSKITDPIELKRYNDILYNPTTYSHEYATDMDLIESTNINQKFNQNELHREHDNISKINKADGSLDINEIGVDSRTQYKKDYQTSSSANVPRQNLLDYSSSNDLGKIPRTDSQKRYMDDLKAYEMYNEGKSVMNRVSDNSLYKSNDMISKSGSNNGIRRHRITTIKKFYSNVPNQNDKLIYVNSSN